MKHLNHYLFVAVAALLATACEKEEIKDQQPTFEGQWTQQLDSRTPIGMTFSDNTFILIMDGSVKIKYIGTFSYEDSLLTLNVEKSYMRPIIFDPGAAEQGKPLQYEDWAESDNLVFAPIVYKVMSFGDSYLILRSQKEIPYSAKGTILYMLRGDSFQTLTDNQLRGTWQGQSPWFNTDSSGYKINLQFDGNSYILHYLAWTRTLEDPTHRLACRYQEGTWTHVENNLTLTPAIEKWSYRLASTDPLRYDYYTIDDNTMEPDQWFDIASQDQDTLEWKACLFNNKLEVIFYRGIQLSLTKQ